MKNKNPTGNCPCSSCLFGTAPNNSNNFNRGMNACQSAVVFHVLTQPSSTEYSGDLQGTIFYQFWIRYCVTFSCYSMLPLSKLMCHATISSFSCLSADPCSKRVPLAFQHLSDLSHSTTTAKKLSFNAVNIDHSLYVFSLFLIVSPGLWNSSPFWSHRILSIRQRQIHIALYCIFFN